MREELITDAEEDDFWSDIIRFEGMKAECLSDPINRKDYEELFGGRW